MIINLKTVQGKHYVRANGKYYAFSAFSKALKFIAKLRGGETN